MPLIRSTRSLSEFESSKKWIAKGAYGNVCSAIDTVTNRGVAIKYSSLFGPLKGRGSSATLFQPVLREIYLLKSISHVNIVKLLDVAQGDAPDEIGLILEFCFQDLESLMDKERVQFSIPDIKCIGQQILAGLEYIHSRRILHRDLKPSNLLLNEDGIVKIGDFGLAREWTPDDDMTPDVVTVWYRPPEIVFGSQSYSDAVDIWSFGCILYEIYTGRPLFETEDEFDLVERMQMKIGAPSDSDWYELSRFPLIHRFRFWHSYAQQQQEAPTTQRLRPFEEISDIELRDLLSNLIRWNYMSRPLARDAAFSPFFLTDPSACAPSELSFLAGCSREKYPRQTSKLLTMNERSGNHNNTNEASGHKVDCSRASNQSLNRSFDHTSRRRSERISLRTSKQTSQQISGRRPRILDVTSKVPSKTSFEQSINKAPSTAKNIPSDDMNGKDRSLAKQFRHQKNSKKRIITDNESQAKRKRN